MSYCHVTYVLLSRVSSYNNVCDAWRTGSWDFNQQSPSHVKAVIKPGDRLVTHCTYNSESSTQRKTFGEGSDDEMCFNFLLVYPAESVPFMCIDLADLAGTSSGQGTPRMGICLVSAPLPSPSPLQVCGCGGLLD